MDKIIRPLTPHEVRALQKTAVQETVRRINAELLRGGRSVAVPTPLAEDICTSMRSSGWCIQSEHNTSYGYTYIDLEETDDALTAETIGADLTGQAPR